MEADVVHAAIEKKKKKLSTVTILTPWDWQQLIRQCTKYSVINMELTDLKKLKSPHKDNGSPFINRKLNCDKESM